MFELVATVFSGSWIATCLVGLGTALFVYWLIQRSKYKYPPGPWAPPLIGHLLCKTFLLTGRESLDWQKPVVGERVLTLERSLVRQTVLFSLAAISTQFVDVFQLKKIKTDLNLKTMLYDVAKWSDTYGPVVTVRLGLRPMVIVNKIDEAMEVLVKKSTDFANRPHSPSFDTFTRGGKNIAMSDYNPTWKLHRRIASKALRHYMHGTALEYRLASALDSAFEELDKRCDGQPFDNTEYFNFIVGNILTGICFGGEYKFADQEVNFILEKEDELLKNAGGAIEDIVPFIRYFYKSKAFKAMEEFSSEVLDGYLGKKYDEARKTFDRMKIRHYTDNLILARLEAEEEEGDEVLKSLTDDHIILTLSDIFFAGIDTSRFTLRFAILHMIAFPDIQKKVQQEIDKVVGKDRLPAMEDRPDLAYTEAVLHESMRLSAVVPGGLPHVTSCDTEIGGYKIPKGTTVTVNLWALHYDPEAWEDVDKFKPERYLDENGKLGPKPKNWLPFGAGKRVCLGEFVAKPELHLLFASLMQRYEWKAEQGTRVDTEAESVFLGRVPKPHKCVIRKRF